MAIAAKVAAERAEQLGGATGYHIGQDNCSSPSTSLLFCTAGIALEMLRLEGRVAPTRAPPHITHTPRGDNLARRTTDCV